MTHESQKRVEDWVFDPEAHTTFLNGYLNATSRALNTQTEFYGLTACFTSTNVEFAEVIQTPSISRTPIRNWSQEFGDCVEQLLESDQRSGMMFYLIEYIAWYDLFMDNSACYKLECEPLFSDTIKQSIYDLDLDNDRHVLLTFFVSNKLNDKINPTARVRVPHGK